MSEFGPVQLLVLGFEDNEHFTGAIMEEVKRLRDHDIVRLIDLLVVMKNEDGSVDAVKGSDLTTDEAMEFGALAGALIGLGMGGEEGLEAGALAGAEATESGHIIEDAEIWYLADAIPPGTTAAIALLEHRWAIPLRDAIADAGGMALADEWLHPADLVAIGAQAAAQ
jgi:uncharacterized membrane protein